MCNGTKPFEILPWAKDQRLANAVPASTPERVLTKSERFQALKSRGNFVLQFAKASLLGRHHGDVQLEKAQAVMDLTLQMDSDSRAKDMDEIVIQLKNKDDAKSLYNNPVIAPEPLTKGDFGISSPIVSRLLY
jgi:hypothetical protein